MLTALTICQEPKGKWYKKIVNKIRGNKIDLQIKSACGVSIQHITYIVRNNKVDWGKLNLLIGNQRNHILCSKAIILPKQLGFKRFDNWEFKGRLASNMGIYILSQIDNKSLKIGLYDLQGECVDAVSHLIKYTGNLVVVTDAPQAFEGEVQDIYEEIGATIPITSNRSQLMDCSLIIAPKKITEQIPASSNSIILTSSLPAVSVSGTVYFNYSFKMPNQFAELKPTELTEEYFCGALYTKGKQYKLGSIVPNACNNENSVQTLASLCDYLSKKENKRGEL